jgi:hypothetical protein
LFSSPGRGSHRWGARAVGVVSRGLLAGRLVSDGSRLSRRYAWKVRRGLDRVRRGEVAPAWAGYARGGVLRRFLLGNAPVRCNRHALNCGIRACYRQVIPGKPGSALDRRLIGVPIY